MYRKRSFSQSYGRGPYKRPRTNYSSMRIQRSMRPKYFRVAGRSAGALVAVQEKKYFDATKASTALVATAASWASTEVDPTANSLFTPTSGSGISNRIGRKVAVHKIKVHGTISFGVKTAQTQVSNYPDVRLILYMDKQTNGAQAQGEDVMASSGTAAAVNNQLTFQSLANFGRFRVLKDKLLSIRDGVATNNAAGTTISMECGTTPFKWNIVFKKPVVVHFNATDGGTIADIVDNSFHMIALSSSTDAYIAYESRVVFTDA